MVTEYKFWTYLNWHFFNLNNIIAPLFFFFTEEKARANVIKLSAAMLNLVSFSLFDWSAQQR